MSKFGKTAMGAAVAIGVGAAWIGIGWAGLKGLMGRDVYAFGIGAAMLGGGASLALVGLIGQALYRIADTNAAILQSLQSK